MKLSMTVSLHPSDRDESVKPDFSGTAEEFSDFIAKNF